MRAFNQKQAEESKTAYRKGREEREEIKGAEDAEAVNGRRGIMEMNPGD